MDPDNHHQFHTESRKVKLLASEKAMLRARVLTTPVRPVVSPFQSTFLFPALRGVAVAFGLVIVVSGPLAYAAQQSAPGNLLHSLEVDIVEEIEESFIFTLDAKQEYHAERLAERLSELRIIQNRHTLTVQESNKVIEEVTEHAEEASHDSVDTAPKHTLPQLIRTSALLSAHKEVLDGLGVNGEQLTELNDTIETRIDARTEEYLASEKDVTIAADLAEKLDRADDILPEITDARSTDELTKRFEDIQDSITNGELDDAYVDATELEIDLLTEEYLRESLTDQD